MEEDQDFFEISANGNFVKITPIEPGHPGAQLDEDRNWINSYIEVKGGCFKGNYTAQLRTHDFAYLKNVLEYLYNNLNHSAQFSDLEGYITINIKGDGIGHFEANCIADNQPGLNSTKLNFDLLFDQTQIPKMARQLDVIIAEFPVIDNFRNKR